MGIKGSGNLWKNPFVTSVREEKGEEEVARYLETVPLPGNPLARHFVLRRIRIGR